MHYSSVTALYKARYFYMLQFYIRGEDGEEYGPVDLAELRDWALDNRIGRETKVRSAEPDSLWRPWGEFPELVAMLAEVEATAVFTRHPKLRIAPIWMRCAAFSVDLVLISTIFWVLTQSLVWLLPPSWGFNTATIFQESQEQESPQRFLVLVILIITSLGYNTYFLGSIGQTPGKGIFGMRVVDYNGESLDYTRAFQRSLFSLMALAQLQIYIFGCLLAFFTNHNRTLHDLLSGTYVVRCLNRSRVSA